MRLEDITAEVRPRGRWEAVDLGFALVRRHFGRLLVAWLVCVVPIWALILWAAQWIGYGWAVILIWWLKPLYDRLPLFILSRALFGATPTLGETVRAWPRLLVGNLWHSLVATRLSGTRTLLMPVTMLEGLRGADRKARSKVLIRHSGGCAGSLTFVSALYEGVLLFGIAALVSMFIPGEAATQWLEQIVDGGLQHGLPPALLWLFVICWLISMTFVELFYAGAGFGLYLNVRTHLEGWDVELAFRRLGRRLAGAVAALMLWVGSAPLHAEEFSPEQEITKIKQEVTEILQHEDFIVHKTESWVPKSGLEVNPDVTGGFLQILGYVLFWAAAVIALVFLARFIARHWHTLRGSGGPREKIAPPPARTVAGLDVTPESLPDDIVAAARQRWQAGDAPGALSLLYRGSLSWLVHTLSLPISDSDTEGDCLRRATQIGEAESRDYFTRLTGHWVNAAYAGQAPQAEAMEALLNGWPYRSRGERRTP